MRNRALPQRHCEENLQLAVLAERVEGDADRYEKRTCVQKTQVLYFQVVPGDRIELPTRGFSVPCSTN